MRIIRAVDYPDGRCELTLEFDNRETADLVKAMAANKNLPQKPSWKDVACRSCMNTGRDLAGNKCACGAAPQFVLIRDLDED